MKKQKVLDLFCGAGGFSCGMEQAGVEIVAGSDNDEKALKTFQYNHKNSIAINYDLSKINYDLFEKLDTIVQDELDVLVGGPPCQGFSIAGKRLGDDPRNKLWLAYINIIEKYNPKVVLLENVPTIVSTKNGKILEKIVESFSEYGYDVSVKILLASHYGVPQNRKRAFFVAVKKGLRPFTFPKVSNEYISTKNALNDLPLLNSSLGEEEMRYEIKAKNKYQQEMRGNSQFIFNHTAVNHTVKTKEIISLVPDGGNYKNLPIHLQGTRKVNIAWTRMNSENACFTIDTGHNHHFHYEANRVPTVRECARIQSFPDKFKFLGTRTSQYRQVGNAVPPLLGKALAKEVLKVLENV
jgi:DNA (cytosine-5)-methyltransferase 1